MKKRNINKELYPKKWVQFLEESYNEDEAIEKYWKFCRSFCLEKYILKYGLINGEQLFNNKLKKRDYGMSLDNCIKRHGKEEGVKIFNKWKSETSGSLKSFIRRYGEDIGKIKYDEFRSKCIVKDIYKNDLDSRYNNRNHNTTIDFYIKKFNVSEEEAKRLLKYRQNTSSLFKFIRKYGELEGKRKYQLLNLKKSHSLDSYVLKYGEREGVRRYNLFCETLKGKNSTQYLIKKYGEEKAKEVSLKKTHTLDLYKKRFGETRGKIKYNNYLKKLLTNDKNYSKISIVLFDEIFEIIKNDFKSIYYKDNEYHFFTNTDQIKMISPDFYIKDINKAIEFYGDYWHRNPNKYNDEESNLIRIKDEQRILTLRKKFNTKVLVIWQSDFVNNSVETINKIKNFIYE